MVAVLLASALLVGGWGALQVSSGRWPAGTALASSATSATSLDYETSPITRGVVRRRVQTAGTVKPVVTAQVGSQLSGQIREIRADFNSVVKAGDVLAVLDAKTFAARIDQANADLDMAKAALVNNLAAHDKATANLRVAERSLQRLKELSSRGVGTDVQLDSAQRDVEVGRAELVISKAQADSARANVTQRQAALSQMTIDFDRTEIRAPIDGIVISRTVEIGQTVAASLSAPELFRIAQDLRQVRIDAQVNEAEIGGVAAGNPVTFKVDAHPGRVFVGKVSQVRLSATEENNVVTYTVVIEAENPDLKLFPGMTAMVEIETARRADVVRVPIEALRFKPRDAKAAPAIDKDERREQQLDRLAKRLQLSPGQLAAAKERLAAFEKSATAAKAGGQPTARVGSTDRLVAVLEPVLDARQREALAAWKDEREETSAASIWLLGSDGEPVRRAVRVGLSDGAQVELLGSSVREDEIVILRARSKPRKDRP